MPHQEGAPEQFDPIENPVQPGTNVDMPGYSHDMVDYSYV